MFYDFSSGAGGNIFAFVKRYNHCSSGVAVEILRKYAGYDGDLTHRPTKLAATVDCKRFSAPQKLKKESKGVVLPDDYMKRYEKRSDKLEKWRAEGISDASMERFQVYYDAFSDRLVYPIRNMDGQIVNVGGRTLDPQYKEKKLRKYTYFFSWGTMQTIYGIAENMKSIQEHGEVILFEGCKSVLIADTWGIDNCGALLTSHLNPSQMKILAKLGCRVVFALDKDVDVTADRNIQRLKRYVNCEYIKDEADMLGEKDSPVDRGKDVFVELYQGRRKLR